MGGFIYKDLYHSPEGSQIDYFNVQSYGSYSLQVYQDIINNGYPPEKIVMGMIYGQNLDSIVKQLKLIKNKNILISWEYLCGNISKHHLMLQHILNIGVN